MAQATGSVSGSGVSATGTTAGFGPRRLRRAISSAGLPRACPSESAVCSACSAAIVARTVLTGLLVPSDLVIMSLTPDNSTTARIAPPERMPVPGAAGLSSTLAAPFFKRISWGMVVPTIGTGMRCFFAGFPEPGADAAVLIADHDEGAEREATAALDDLRHPVQVDDFLREFRLA